MSLERISLFLSDSVHSVGWPSNLHLVRFPKLPSKLVPLQDPTLLGPSDGTNLSGFSLGFSVFKQRRINDLGLRISWFRQL